MYYAIIFIVLVFFVLLEQVGLNARSKRICYNIAYLMLMTTAAFRYETGGDWYAYEDIFYSIEPIDEVIAGKGHTYNTISIEAGFLLLSSISRYLVDNVQFLFFIIAPFISTIVFKRIKLYSPYPLMGIMIYFGILFFSLDMFVIRQAMAVVIIFWGYVYIEERKFWRYLLLCLIASLFHVSALIGPLIYLVCRRRYSTTLIIIVTIVVSMLLILQVKWLTPLMTMLLSTQLDQSTASKIATYTATEVYAASRGITFGYLINIVVLVMVLLNRKQMESQKYFNLFLNLFVLYIVVYCSLGELVEVSNRFKYYFMISFVVLIPQLVKSFTLENNRKIFTIFAIFFAFMYCRAQVLQLPSAIGYNPYQSYLIYMISPYESDGHQRIEKSKDLFQKVRGV